MIITLKTTLAATNTKNTTTAETPMSQTIIIKTIIGTGEIATDVATVSIWDGTHGLDGT